MVAAGERTNGPNFDVRKETREDVLFTGHRGHGHVLAKGSDMRAVFAEIIGRDSGLCRGRGGWGSKASAARQDGFQRACDADPEEQGDGCRHTVGLHARDVGE